MIRVIALLDPESAHGLSDIGPTISSTFVHSWQRLSEIARSREVDAALVELRRDSKLFDSENLEDALGILRQLPLPLILLCDGSLFAFRIVVRVARHRSAEVAIRRDEHSVEGLEEAIAATASSSLGMVVATRLFSAAPPSALSAVVTVLERLFMRPGDFADGRAAARHGQLSTTLLNQRLRSSGLLPFHVLRRAARVALAYQMAADYGLPIKQLVARTGCGSIDTLERDVRRATGSSLKELVRLTPRAKLVDILVGTCVAQCLTIDSDHDRAGSARHE